MVKNMSDEKISEELKRDIKRKHKLSHAPKTEHEKVDLSAEKALLEKLRREGKLEEED